MSAMNLEFNKYSSLEELRSATHSGQSAAGNYAAQPCFSVDLTRDPTSVWDGGARLVAAGGATTVRASRLCARDNTRQTSFG